MCSAKNETVGKIEIIYRVSQENKLIIMVLDHGHGNILNILQLVNITLDQSLTDVKAEVVRSALCG